ncbi:MAG: glycosyl transferase family protein [Halioglobus sp.]|nr:glycosyl transferase family protein [Halioglobus sp.]
MSKANTTASDTEHPFAVFIRILGKGKAGSRALSQDEARQAFDMILSGKADPIQVGAFLMLLRVKEESPEELAGFVEACRDNMKAPPHDLCADLDWSSYAGKKHQHPWFILSILLLTQAGYRVFIHGSSGHTPGRLYTEDAMQQLGLPVASGWSDVSQQLTDSNLSYLSVAHFCYPLEELMQLRPLLGLRSPVNTLSRLINPLRARATVQSIFHPAYARLHQEADRILEQPSAVVFKGDSGEAEVKPHADTRLYLLQRQTAKECLLPRTFSKRVDAVTAPDVASLKALWCGSLNDQYGLNATLATAAAALLVLCPTMDLASAQSRAGDLWQDRDTSRLS